MTTVGIVPRAARGIGFACAEQLLGTVDMLRSIAHAAGISPTMADWRRVVAVDLVGTAVLVQAVRG
jgi:hypothetical protein